MDGATLAPAVRYSVSRVPATHIRQVHTAATRAPHSDWSYVSRSPARNSVPIVFLDGRGGGCANVYRANIVETDNYVEIELLTRALHSGQGCQQVGIPKLVHIQLTASLGSRRLLEPVPGL